MSSPKITTWIACLAFLYAGIPGLAQRGTAQRNRRRLWKYRKFAGRGNYDEPPLFAADGQAALEQWLAENITYPTTGFENGLHGEVTVRFTVEPDGSLDGIEATAYDDAGSRSGGGRRPAPVAPLAAGEKGRRARRSHRNVTGLVPQRHPPERGGLCGRRQPTRRLHGRRPDSFPLLGHVQSGVPHRRIRQQYRRDGSRPFRHRHGGCLTDTHVVASPHSSLTREVLRVLRMSPQWEPARQDGKTVMFRYSLPVIFSMHGTTSGAYTRIGSPTW